MNDFHRVRDLISGRNDESFFVLSRKRDGIAIEHRSTPQDPGDDSRAAGKIESSFIQRRGVRGRKVGRTEEKRARRRGEVPRRVDPSFERSLSVGPTPDADVRRP